MTTFANGSNCYTFSIRFDRKVQIWFLLVEIFIESIDTNIGLELTPFVNKFRTCVEYRTDRHNLEKRNDTTFGFYFVCNLNNGSDISIEETHLLDTITFDIKTNSTEEVGLEAIHIGDIYRTTARTGSKIVKPDCGLIHYQTVGVVAIQEVDRIYVSCNESFIDLNRNQR